MQLAYQSRLYNQLQVVSSVGLVRPFIISFLFILAFGIRIYHINEPPLDFHATRQYRYFLDARRYYYEILPSVPDWKKQVAQISKQTEGTLEPTIMPWVVSRIYSIIGG